MKIREAKDIFDQLVDIFADEGVADWEFSRHLNTAMVQIVRGNIYNKFTKQGSAGEPLYSMEQSSIEAKDITALYYEQLFTPTTTNLIPYTDIGDIFPNDIVRGPNGIIDGPFKPDILSILALETQDGLKPTFWARHNDAAVLRRNSLSRPSASHPHIQKTRIGIRVEPGVPMVVKVNRMPLHVWYDETSPTDWVDPELSDPLMYDAVYRAVLLSGIQIRDKDLQQAMASVASI